ncbi:hypothetical protein DRO31_07720 [Candidatus Bathyarchaeota archaeon]|nr:MAG: hypothetical protein DRO31_07720 [Candidatus Bathyarchaeota archaeon]
MLKRGLLMRAGILVAVVLIIGLLAGFTGGYFLTPTVTTTKILTSTTTSPMTVTTASPTTIYKTETVTSKITETKMVTETKTETSMITTTAYSTVTQTVTLVKNVQVVTINSTFTNLSLQYPLTAVWKPEGLNLTIIIRFRSYLLPPKKPGSFATDCDISILNTGDKPIRELLFMIFPYKGGKHYSEYDYNVTVRDLEPGGSRSFSYAFGVWGLEPNSFKFAVLVLEVGEEAQASVELHA